MGRLILVIAAFFVAIQLNAQQYNFAPQQAYTFVFKLDSVQANYIHKKGLSDNPWFFQNKVDSFLVYQPKLAPGMYILARYQEPNLQYQILNVPFAKIQVNSFNDLVQLRLFDTSWQVDPNLSIWVNNELVLFDTLCDCYNLGRSKKERSYFIKKNEDFMMGEITGDYKSYPTEIPPSFGGRPAISHGYFMLNQPKFHLQDSVKLKAYILNEDGIAFTRPLKLYLITEYYPYTRVFMGYVKPETRGAYVHQFKLADTLKIDQQYRLEFADKGGVVLQTTFFRVEDYKLRNSTYSVQANKIKIYKGEKIKLILNAKDANDLPLTDARVRLRLRLNSFQNFTGKFLFVPNEWYEKLYETFVEMDIANATEIIVPSNALPPLDMKLTAEISFSNAAGELQKKEIALEVVQAQSYYTLDYAEGVVFSAYIFEGKSKSLKVILKGYNNNEVLRIDTLFLPVQRYIDPNCDKYQLQDSLGNLIQWLFLPHMPQPLLLEGIRTHDSIFIQSYNPGNFPFYYRIYKGDKLILAGKERWLNYAKGDTSLASYNVIYTTMYRASTQVREAVYTFKEKELSVKTNLPYEIYPGQTLAVNIQVLNSDRKAQPNVNLTAFGINAQFDGMYTPSVPYFGSEKNKILLQDRTRLNPWPFSVENKVLAAVSYTTLLKSGFVFMGDYRLRYPNEILFVQQKKLAQKQIEFIPFVVGNGKRIEVYYMEIDGRPSYVKNGNLPSYAYWINAGNHAISLRTKTATYILPAMNLEDSNRYIFSFDTLCLPAGIAKIPTKYNLGFSEAEMLKIKKHLFVFAPNNFSQYRRDVYFCAPQQIQSFNFPLANKYLNNGALVQYYFGLFQFDTLAVFANGSLFQKIRFEPNSRYVYFRERIIREELDSVELPYDFAFFKTQDESFRSLYDTAMGIILPIKMKLPLAGNSPTKAQTSMDESCYFNYRFEPKPNGDVPKTKLVISGLYAVDLRKILLINEGDELQSLLNPTVSNGQYDIIFWLNPGSYNIYFTNGKNQLGRILKQQVLADGQLLICLDSTDFKHTCSELEALVLKAKRLQEIYNMRESMLVNYRKDDYVELREKATVQIGASDEKQPMLSGFVFDNDGSALSDVIVTLEQLGRVKGISFSDASGGFMIRDVEAGNYQLRLTRYGSCVTIIQQIVLQKNKLHNVSIRLQDCGFALKNGVVIPSIYFGKSAIGKEEFAQYENSKEPLILGTGMIKGRIVDVRNKKPLDFVTLKLKGGNGSVLSGLTDDDGEFVLKNISPGTYELSASYIGYKNAVIANIWVLANEVRFVNFTMEQSDGTTLQEVRIFYKKQLIDPSGVNGNVASSKEMLSAGTRSVNKISGTTLGVDGISSATPNFRGSRVDGNAYYIDGVRVNAASVSVPQNTIDKMEIVELSMENKFKMEQRNRLAQMAGNKVVKAGRDNFRDYAFWVPNLVTNKYGEAHVSITFPDNITRWRNFILAMDEGLRTKLYAQDIRSFKPLSAQLFLPSFALKGDEIFIKGKLTNYTGDSLSIKTKFFLNDSLLKQTQHQVAIGLVENVLVRAEKADTIRLAYRLETELNYADGEKYLLPILPNGIEQNNFDYYDLKKDTLLHFATQVEGDYALSISNNYTQLIRDEIKRLQAYQYGCVEQTASKLNALLVEKKLCKLLGDSFSQNDLIKVCLKRLQSLQQSNGAYGWFSRSPEEIWLTHYVLKSLQTAQKMGYESKALKDGLAFFKKNFQQFNRLDKIRAMEVLFENRVDLNYTEIIDQIKEESLPLYDRLLLTSLKQKLQMAHFSGFLFEGIQKEKEGGVYWNHAYINIYQNQSSVSLMAYEVLKFDGADSSILAGIRKHFFNEKTFGSGYYRNTFESAQVLQSMANDIAIMEKGNLQTRIKLNGKDLGNEFPIRLKLTNNASYSLSKFGASAKLFVHRKMFVEKPWVDSSLFKISTHFMQDGKSVSNLKTNIEANYVVSINSLKNQEYVMVQIPIAASFNYLSKLSTFGADEIEYHKDKVILYFRKMRAGNYVFSFSLEPRFEGKFTLLPIQVENMYSPEIKGNNLVKSVMVNGN